ncbi:hypothetical protein ACWEGQ_00190 [Streptomyces seoulensis]
MTSLIAGAAFLLYLAGIGGLAHAWPNAIRRNPQAQLLTDTHPTGVCLLLALVTITWPITLTYALISYISRPGADR